MFSLAQLQAAHSKVKSGADFPAYIQEIKDLGVTHYTTYVADGKTIFHGDGTYQQEGPVKYATLAVTEAGNPELFQERLTFHQQGVTDYPTFCSDAALCGVEKWVVDLNDMTCTYYDRLGEVMLREEIPG